MSENQKLFEKFIADAKQQVDRASNSGEVSEKEMLAEIGKSLKNILGKPGWLPDAYIKPRQDRYAQYPLYIAPDDSFSIVSFVWLPGQSTPIHDHTVWGLVGIHEGVERTEAIHEVDGKMVVTKTIDATAGQVGAFSPAIGDIHRVSNVSEEVSVSIHVYGGNIGKISRHVFDADTAAPTEFISGYEPVEPLTA